MKVGIAAVAVGFVLVAALVSGVVDLHDAHRMPTPDEIAPGNAAAVAEAGPHDTFRPYPRWFADVRVGLGTLPILMGDPADTWDLSEHERLFQLVARSHLVDADAEAAAFGLTDMRTLYETSRYLVRVGTLPPAESAIAWDGLRMLHDAQVSQRTVAGAERVCELWRRDAWHCGRVNEYIYVGASFREMGDQNPHRCIMANPPEGNASWVVRWPDVPAAGGTLRWQAGNEYMAIRADRGQPVVMSVLVDDEKVWEHSFGIHDESYDIVEVPLPDTPTVDITVELHAADHFDRFFCFRPQVVR